LYFFALAYTWVTPVYPTLLHLGNITIPTFGVLAAIGLICGLMLSEHTAKRAGVEPGKLWDAGLFAVIAAFVFSRVLLVVQHWRSFVEFPVLLLAVPSLTAAGLLMTVVATFVWLWMKQVPMLRALDAWAPCGALVWAFLALGHFAEGSDPAMPSRSGWAHPVALYAAALAVAITVAAWFRLRTNAQAGQVAGGVLLAAGMAQFVLSFVRVPGIEYVAGLDALQWVAAGMMVAGCALILVARPREVILK
jgi:phosphatidylglycerol:prolipoprotein diacylglycerol transferase